MSHPKTLAERLDWMAANLPGFRHEMDVVLELKQGSRPVHHCEVVREQASDDVVRKRAHP